MGVTTDKRLAVPPKPDRKLPPTPRLVIIESKPLEVIMGSKSPRMPLTRGVMRLMTRVMTVERRPPSRPPAPRRERRSVTRPRTGTTVITRLSSSPRRFLEQIEGRREKKEGTYRTVVRSPLRRSESELPRVPLEMIPKTLVQRGPRIC